MPTTKVKQFTVTNRLSSQAKAWIKNCIEMHDYYKRSYHWSGSNVANIRRNNEKRFAARHPPFDLINGDSLIEVRPAYSESCRNVYYSLSVYVNGEKKDIRYLKNLV